MRLFTLIFFLVASFRAYCQDTVITSDVPSPNKPWTSLDLNNDPEKFQFVVVTDRTGGHRPGIWMKGVERINLMQPEFVVSVGDLIEGYTEDMEELSRQWTEFNSFIAALEMPFFYVAGNHDYTNRVMADLWQKQFGTDHYYFVYKNTLFLCLNSEDGATALKDPDLGDAQLAFAKKVLAEYPDVRWTLVFMHQPLWLTPTAQNWQTLETILSDRKHSVFTGHLHQYTLHNRNKSDYFVLATMGGGSELRGKQHGEFDHFMWVTMTPDGPYYANVLLDGVEGKNILTAEDLAREDEFNARPPVRFQPVYFNGQPQNQISWEVRFENTTEQTHQYTVTFHPAPGMTTSAPSIQKELAPGQKEVMEIPVTIAPEWKGEAITATVDLRSDTYKYGTSIHLMPNPRHTISKATSPIEVDGDISEWGKLPFEKNASDQDAGFRFDLREGDQFLYLAVAINDEDLQAGFGNSNLTQDAFFVLFDARPLEQSAYNLRHKDGIFRGEWLFLTASPTGDTFGLGFQELMPPGMTGKGKRTNTGYTIEFAIPHALLDRFQNGNWETIRFGFSLNDKDQDTGEVPVQLPWLPDWTENYPGTGMFFRK